MRYEGELLLESFPSFVIESKNQSDGEKCVSKYHRVMTPTKSSREFLLFDVLFLKAYEPCIWPYMSKATRRLSRKGSPGTCRDECLCCYIESQMLTYPNVYTKTMGGCASFSFQASVPAHIECDFLMSSDIHDCVWCARR